MMICLNPSTSTGPSRTSLAVPLMSRRRKRQNRDVPRPFNSDRHLPLMLCTVSRDPSRNDLSPLCDKISKDLWVFVIDIQFLIRTESADLSPHERFLLPVGACSFRGSLHSILLVFLTHSAVANPAFEDWACRCSGSTLSDHRPSGRCVERLTFLFGSSLRSCGGRSRSLPCRFGSALPAFASVVD